MSLCDTCPQPGHCCRAIHLSTSEGSTAASLDTVEEAEAELTKFNILQARYEAEDRWNEGQLPFRALGKFATGTLTPYWLWWCPNLHPVTGRCMDYENRPELCISYQPKDDNLCILYEEPKDDDNLSSEDPSQSARTAEGQGDIDDPLHVPAGDPRGGDDAPGVQPERGVVAGDTVQEDDREPAG